MARILSNDSLPSEKVIPVSIKFNLDLAAPTGIGIIDISSNGFRIDVDDGPAGSTTMFELNASGSSVWTVIKNTTDSFAVVASLQPNKLYQVRAHYIFNGAHSQYAFANATTLGA
ncbi:hypothetical protein [Allohahella sp. A8]|uniref:hypothetical protein n=1 Tax=Allohahella sp. A8 TaxID=3141461 RepID=UPI003A806763